MTKFGTRFLVGTACCLVLILGAILIPYAGIEEDESIFGAPLYLPSPDYFCVTLFHHPVALMVQSYAGTFKTLLYLPIFAVFHPTVWSVRLPMVFAGALTVLVFFLLARRCAGSLAALLAACLLATDPIFLVSDTIDWGPVALEHLLLVTGCFFLVRFAQDVSRRDLAFGFFCFGLALWNKAVFVWALAGLACGALVVFRAEIFRLLRPWNVLLAGGAFLFGALPFFVYNVHQPNSTFDSKGHFEAPNLGYKLRRVAATADGSGLLGFIPADDSADLPKSPSSRIGRLAVWIRAHAGEHRQDGLAVAFLVALIAFPLWWRSRAARFSLMFLAAAWIAMAVTKDGGVAIHHSVLLWPFPHLFVAAGLSSLPWRRIAITAGVVLVATNLLVVNQYIYQFERNGAAGNFTDALFGLSGALPGPANTEAIYVQDWGMLNALALLHAGRLPLRVGWGPFHGDATSESNQTETERMFDDPHGLFIGHVSEHENFTGGNDRLNRAATAAGYRKELLRTIPDSNGRPRFEIFAVRR